jgi:hypothetical protein
MYSFFPRLGVLLLRVELLLVGRQRCLNVHREVLLDLACLHQTAGLLTKDGVLTHVGAQAAALLHVLAHRKREEGRHANYEETAVALRGIAPPRGHRLRHGVLDACVDPDVKEVRRTKLTANRRGAGGVHRHGTHDRACRHDVRTAPPLPVLLDLPVALCLELAPAEHPLVQVLKGQLYLHLVQLRENTETESKRKQEERQEYKLLV